MTEHLVNLCTEAFVNNASSTCVCCDGYSVSNLIAIEPQTRKRGLRVEHFIRPPLSITIEFKYPMNITSVLIKPSLGAESKLRLSLDGSHVCGEDYTFSLHRGFVVKDTNALVHLKNKSYPTSDKTCLISSKDVSMVRGSQVSSECIHQCSIIEQPMRHINIIGKLKRLTLNVTRLTGIKPFALEWVEVWGTISKHCSSSLEKADFKTAVERIPQSSDHHSQPKINLFTNHSSHHLTPNTFLAPKDIISNSGPSQSAKSQSSSRRDSLGLELKKPILGYSLRSKALKRKDPFPEGTSVCSDSKRAKMEETLYDKDSSKPKVNTSHTSKLQQELNQNISSIELQATITGNNPSETRAPERFLDSLTYEVMLLPMILPSGHHVDRSTLDKLAHNDSLYGRPPTDPYTGVAFSEQSQPQFCPELKVEVDEFLSSGAGCELMRGSGATVGSATEITRHVQSNSRNKRSVPVQSTSSNLGGPTEQWTCKGHSQSSHDSITQSRKPSHCARGEHSSFENKVSGSLDAALSKLFS